MEVGQLNQELTAFLAAFVSQSVCLKCSQYLWCDQKNYETILDRKLIAKSHWDRRRLNNVRKLLLFTQCLYSDTVTCFFCCFRLKTFHQHRTLATSRNKFISKKKKASIGEIQLISEMERPFYQGL